MLSQIRQISDGNHNTVFVKNKEQKFNLDKEIHDLECWKQSRNHVYRKEERELLQHLEKLRQQQEYLHHLDEERVLHPKRVSSRSEEHHTRELLDNISDTTTTTTLGRNDNREVSLVLNLQGPSDFQKQVPPSSSPVVSLPPVLSSTDRQALHRTDAYINICVACQLPRRSAMKHGHHVTTDEVCCCEHEGKEEGTGRGRRFTIASLEEHHGTRPAPVEVGQRRHSLMMARLNDKEYEPHPPDKSRAGHSRESHHSLDAARRNPKDHHDGHIHDHHGHIHDHHGNNHHHLGHVHHHHGTLPHHHNHNHHDNNHNHHGNNHNHHGNTHHHHHGHDHQGNIDHHHYDHDHHGSAHHPHGHVHDNHGDTHHHHGNAHHLGNALHSSPHSTNGHGNSHQRHNHHGNHTTDVTHTPSNSPHRSSRHSIGHPSRHDPMYSAYHSADRMSADCHPGAKRNSDAALHFSGNLGTGVQGTQSDTRRRDHELHWDKHQVCKLRGMITDPHYKEQLEVESGKSYPWSSQYHQNKTSNDEIEDLRNCRYLRFSKLNLESMKENPEEEVEVFEKKESPP